MFSMVGAKWPAVAIPLAFLTSAPGAFVNQAAQPSIAAVEAELPMSAATEPLREYPVAEDGPMSTAFDTTTCQECWTETYHGQTVHKWGDICEGGGEECAPCGPGGDICDPELDVPHAGLCPTEDCPGEIGGLELAFTLHSLGARANGPAPKALYFASLAAFIHDKGNYHYDRERSILKALNCNGAVALYVSITDPFEQHVLASLQE